MVIIECLQIYSHLKNCCSTIGYCTKCFKWQGKHYSISYGVQLLLFENRIYGIGLLRAYKNGFLSILGQLKGTNSLIDKQHSGLKLISVISVNRAGQGLIR